MIVPGSVNPHLLGSGLTLNLTVNSDAYNIRTAALAAGWDGVSPVTINVTNSGARRGISTAGYALDTDVAFPAGSKIVITNSGSPVGKGGAPGGYPGYSGGTGGPSLRLRSSCPWELINSGNIVGGGGGGGWGGGKHDASGDAYHSPTGGGAPGPGLVAESFGTINNAAGTIASGGVGGNGGSGDPGGQGSGGGGGGGAGEGSGGLANTWSCPATAGLTGAILTPGAGGAGSDCGVAGAAGTNGGALGGGTAVIGNAYITWAATGTRLGAIT